MGDQSGGSFEERLRAARERQGLDQPPAAAPVREADTGAMGIALRVGVELVAALAVGVAIGWGLDRWLGTRPWFLVLFVLLGGAAGVMNVMRLMGPRRGMGND